MVKFILLLISALYSASGQECLALALSGGGGRGGYEAGVLFAWANSTSGKNFKYNVVTGISIGAVNAALVSQYPMGQELAMANYMLGLWRSIKITQMFTSHGKVV